MKRKRMLCGWLLVVLLTLSACTDRRHPMPGTAIPENESVASDTILNQGEAGLPENTPYISWQEIIPPYEGKGSVSINDGIPFFTLGDLTTESFEEYSELDGLGRCGPAFANICKETMPDGERGSIGSISPTGWHTVKYDVIADRYLYNRCHLIGYQLAGENANERNLITGTRFLNVEGMLPLENQVDNYVEETGNHVLYRVTPYFEGENLVASGVLMEAYSVEDSGGGICFNVYCYNVQPGILIDYATGESSLDESWIPPETPSEYDYVLNTNTKKFHMPDCSSTKDMKEENREYFTGGREELIKDGYTPCSRCKP